MHLGARAHEVQALRARAPPAGRSRRRGEAPLAPADKRTSATRHNTPNRPRLPNRSRGRGRDQNAADRTNGCEAEAPIRNSGLRRDTTGPTDKHNGQDGAENGHLDKDHKDPERISRYLAITIRERRAARRQAASRAAHRLCAMSSPGGEATGARDPSRVENGAAPQRAVPRAARRRIFKEATAAGVQIKSALCTPALGVARSGPARARAPERLFTALPCTSARNVLRLWGAGSRVLARNCVPPLREAPS